MEKAMPFNSTDACALSFTEVQSFVSISFELLNSLLKVAVDT
jgi:hypothetical protein